ncbi:hypothetical protein M3201_06500 [Paenibacillus motobuensis]|uniref:amylo-alpha-1,6-glucosidase n=1 Tax=Paenibacillus TaxID=44249 RepID=UPI00203EADCA|nr:MULTISPECIES: amylo-alpha-1,6-glucosidase [Paenibacillus]MCM3039351.1 hypothetical protein [Paenibacillus lutimineralis]MCM3646455.1 hypothetical protein [Paenibacillus motobuensis]
MHNHQPSSKVLDEMKIFVPAEANRAISFTNKEAAFYFTQSHETNHMEHAHFAGMNIAKNRIFSGYGLMADQVKLDNRNSEVNVYPYKLERIYGGGLTEELWMFDYKNIVEVGIAGAVNTIGIELRGEQLDPIGSQEEAVLFRSMEGNWIIAVSCIDGQAVQLEDHLLSSKANAGGFYIAVAKTADEAIALIHTTRSDRRRWKRERIQRMENFLQQHVHLTSSDPKLALAMNWMNMTMDQLVTRQQGDGIYAGLPWFNEYWGRDQFISLPGACLVTGQFKTARNILLSFAEFQNTDEQSIFFGRVPNILAPENIDYHTTDGTPRFIIQLQDYVKYSGDTEIIKELYPAVRNSIEGSIKHWVDDKGYLMHADNETWMDARDANLNSYSPRDTRANDIQALWYNQLCAGVYFAEFMNDEENASKWSDIAEKLRRHFAADFRDETHPYLADRLDAQDQAEFALRPNQLFAFDMFEDEDFKCRATRTAWEELVYPWGVASLDRSHPLFHPFHLTPHYHKDAAYHNGAVWLWLNGIAMQRMIELGQEETAYKLFKNMNWQALNLGVVGGLAENMDAYPQAGERWAKLTGAYLQAWSNAEHLRVWYQYFLGLRPDLIQHTLTIAPRIPRELQSLDYLAKIGAGQIEASYKQYAGYRTYHYNFIDIAVDVVIDIAPFEIARLEVQSGYGLTVKQTEDHLHITLQDRDTHVIKELSTALSESRTVEAERNCKMLHGVKFTEPLGLEHHPVINL